MDHHLRTSSNSLLLCFLLSWMVCVCGVVWCGVCGSDASVACLPLAVTDMHACKLLPTLPPSLINRSSIVLGYCTCSLTFPVGQGSDQEIPRLFPSPPFSPIGHTSELTNPTLSPDALSLPFIPFTGSNSSHGTLIHLEVARSVAVRMHSCLVLSLL